MAGLKLKEPVVTAVEAGLNANVTLLAEVVAICDVETGGAAEEGLAVVVAAELDTFKASDCDVDDALNRLFAAGVVSDVVLGAAAPNENDETVEVVFKAFNKFDCCKVVVPFRLLSDVVKATVDNR